MKKKIPSIQQKILQYIFTFFAGGYVAETLLVNQNKWPQALLFLVLSIVFVFTDVDKK